jgi:hypothetical protein
MKKSRATVVRGTVTKTITNAIHNREDMLKFFGYMFSDIFEVIHEVSE